MTSLRAALCFLTVIPWPSRSGCSAGDISRAAAFFPVVGLLLGSALAAVDLVLQPLGRPALAGVVIIAVLAFLTGGFHLDGLGDTFDGLGAGGTRERMLDAMGDSRVGAIGVVAIVLVLLCKLQAIESLEGDRWRALIAAPVLGRWGMLVLGYRARAAKPGLGSALLDGLHPARMAAATLVTLVLVTAILQAPGLFVMLWVALLGRGARVYFRRRLGGVTGDTFGTVAELSETSTLLILALGVR